jgi:hypothetical protein
VNIGQLRLKAPDSTYIETEFLLRCKIRSNTTFGEAADLFGRAGLKVRQKQRHTSKRIFERLRDEHGFKGRITIVTNYVAGWRDRRVTLTRS